MSDADSNASVAFCEIFGPDLPTYMIPPLAVWCPGCIKRCDGVPFSREKIAYRCPLCVFVMDVDCKSPHDFCRDFEYVYFISGGGLIKIGWTASVGSRLWQLRHSSPVSLEVVLEMAIPSGCAMTVEFALHKQFAHLRHHGEWFTAAPELLDFIKGLQGEA